MRSNPFRDLLLLAIRPQLVPEESPTVTWIRKHPIPAVVGLAYGLTWLGLVPLLRDSSLASRANNLSHAGDPAVLLYAFLGVLGCLWAALIVAGAVGGSAGRYALLRGYLKWRAGLQWYLAALFGPVLVFAVAVGLYNLWTGHMPVLPAFNVLSASLVSAYVFFLNRFLFGNFEEICWRGSVLPRLQATNNALAASLISGVIQGMWHLPYLFVLGHYVQRIGLLAIVIQSMAMGIAATWLYNNTRGSLLLVALFHASYDALSQFQGFDASLFYVLIAVWCAAAGILVILFGARHLSHKPDSELAYVIIPSQEK